MITINVDDLQVGSIAENDFYSSTGSLLISKGVVISPNHINILKGRNVFELYVEESKIKSENIVEEKKIEKEPPKPQNNDEIKESEQKPKALDLPIFKNIPSGQNGFEQLNQSPKAKILDLAIMSGKVPDTPVGISLGKESNDELIEQRTTQYKSAVSGQYNTALADVRGILTAIANGEHVDGLAVRSIVERFIKMFITDKNILLNISMTKSPPEDYLFHHTLNVCLMSINIASASSYSKEQVIEIGMGALLHDVGMLLVPREILKKKRPLSSYEVYEIQKHPVIGLHLLEKVSHLPKSVPLVAYQTHERENGQGYPKKRTSRLIHNYAKIVQIADIFEAVSSPRMHRSNYLPYKAIEMIIRMTKEGLVSSKFVKSFLMYTSLFPVGSMVELSDNRFAKVVKANGSSFSKPIVSVVADNTGRQINKEKNYLENLCVNQNIQIIRALKTDIIEGLDLMTGF